MDLPDIPTPVPESIIGNLRQFFSGGVIDVLWKLLVAVFLAVLAYTLLSMGLIGGVIGGILIGALLTDDVRAFAIDLWDRNFWVWRT